MLIDGIIIGLLAAILIIVIFTYRKKGEEISTLEHSVKLKKLKLSEKVLDDQLKGNPSLMEVIQHNAAVEQAERDEKEKEENDKKVIIKGYKN